MKDDTVLWCFDYFYHMDKANAQIHCSPVRFSPITFRLMDLLLRDWPINEDITQELAEVSSHNGQYALDLGR